MNGNKYSYKEDLLDRLRDAEYAQMYLDAAAKESRGTLLLALRNVVEARMGMSKLASDADVDRVHLYRALSEEGNPTLSTFTSVLDALNMGFGIFQKELPKEAAAPQSAAPLQQAEANAVKIPDNAIRKPQFASVWSTTFGGNLAGTADREFINNKPTGIREEDIIACLMAQQMSEKQEAAQGKI